MVAIRVGVQLQHLVLEEVTSIELCFARIGQHLLAPAKSGSLDAVLPR